MFEYKCKQNLIINNNLPLFTTLCLCAVIFLGWKVDYWYFLFLSLIPFTFKRNRPSAEQLIICFTTLCVFLIIFAFIPDFSLFKLIGGLNNPIKNSIFDLWDKWYSPELSSFIKLILFNVKSQETYEFYKQTVDLGIVWLIGISGFHISLLSKLIKLMFRKKIRIAWFVNMTIIFFYGYLLGFTYGCMRVFCKICLEPFFRYFKIEKYERLGWIGLNIAIINPSCFSSISFLLSMLVCVSANFIVSLELNNKIINSLLINLLAVIVTIPFIIGMNHKISLLTFINSFIFNYLFSFVFLYFLTFAWMPFMAIVHQGIMIACYVIIGNISFSNIFIYSKTWPVWLVYLYYLIVSTLSRIIYFIVYNNKI